MTLKDILELTNSEQNICVQFGNKTIYGTAYQDIKDYLDIEVTKIEAMYENIYIILKRLDIVMPPKLENKMKVKLRDDEELYNVSRLAIIGKNGEHIIPRSCYSENLTNINSKTMDIVAVYDEENNKIWEREE